MAFLDFLRSHDEVESRQEPGIKGLERLSQERGHIDFEEAVDWMERCDEADRNLIAWGLSGVPDWNQVDTHDPEVRAYIYYIMSHANDLHSFQACVREVAANMHSQAVRPSVAIFLGMQAEHFQNGKRGDFMKKSAANDWARFMMDLSDQPPKKKVKLPVTDFGKICREVPFLKPLLKKSPLTKHHVEHELRLVGPEMVATLIGYLRFLTEYQRKIRFNGMSAGRFLRIAQDFHVGKMGQKAFEHVDHFAEHSAEITDTMLYGPLEHATHDPVEAFEHLKHHQAPEEPAQPEREPVLNQIFNFVKTNVKRIFSSIGTHTVAGVVGDVVGDALEARRHARQRAQQQQRAAQGGEGEAEEEAEGEEEEHPENAPQHAA